jgi:hypothetical protein
MPVPQALRVSLVALAVATASGCASGHSAGTTQSRPPHYSAGEVVRAFASQGIQLHRAVLSHQIPDSKRLTPAERRQIRQEWRDEVYLEGGKPPHHGVFAVLNAPYLNGRPSGGKLFTSTQGNLVVAFDGSKFAAVHAALARLR